MLGAGMAHTGARMTLRGGDPSLSRGAPIPVPGVPSLLSGPKWLFSRPKWLLFRPKWLLSGQIGQNCHLLRVLSFSGVPGGGSRSSLARRGPFPAKRAFGVGGPGGLPRPQMALSGWIAGARDRGCPGPGRAVARPGRARTASPGTREPVRTRRVLAG